MECKLSQFILAWRSGGLSRRARGLLFRSSRSADRQKEGKEETLFRKRLDNEKGRKCDRAGEGGKDARARRRRPRYSLFGSRWWRGRPPGSKSCMCLDFHSCRVQTRGSICTIHSYIISGCDVNMHAGKMIARLLSARFVQQISLQIALSHK